MKTQTTRRYIQAVHTKVFQTGCNLQNLLIGRQPSYYLAGVYGWNADVYSVGSFAVCMGYRGMTGMEIPYKLSFAFDEKARKIYLENYKEWDNCVKLLDDLISLFIEELEKLSQVGKKKWEKEHCGVYVIPVE